MELKEGQRLRVKEFKNIPGYWNVEMKKWMRRIVTFKEYTNYSNIKIYEDRDWLWDKSDFQIVFDTWEDVRNIIEEECNKYECCNKCGLENEDVCYSTENYKQLAENFEKMFGMECYVLDDDNDDKIHFTLKNIEDEMIVKLRNGIVYISLGENFIGENGFMPKSKYLSNFKCRTNSNFDIIEIYEKNKKYGSGFKGMFVINEDSELLWKEEKEQVTKDVSLEEINALLKEKYPDVEKFNLPIDK